MSEPVEPGEPGEQIAATADETAAPQAPGTAVVVVLAIVFAVLFAGPLVPAISDLIVYPQYIGDATPWWLLIAAVAIPPVLYGAGLLMSRGRPPLGRVIVLAAALGAANALTISGIAIAPLLLPA